jgi:hypothetical protein
VNCECRKANRNCTSCLCLKNCSNSEGNPASCVEIKRQKTELELGTPKTLNFEDKRGEDKEDDNEAPKKDGAQQPSESSNPGDEKTEVEELAQSIGDLPGYVPTEVDLKLKEVYGDYPHQNDGTHLDGGIKDDALWQGHWRKLVSLPSNRFQAPGGAVGRRFVRMLTQELLGIKERKWNSEKFIVFSMVILQKSKQVTNSGDIKRRITNRLDSWENGKFDMLVQDTHRTAMAQLSKMRGQETEEQRGKTFSRLVLQGKLRSAVRYLTEREKGGIMLPDEIDEKTGDTVLEVLQSKHPESRVPDISLMEEYDSLPDFVELDITADTVEKVARRLSGSAGPGGTDASDLQHWLLRFGGASSEFRKAAAEFVRWKANGNPPWAAYRALRGGRLACGS